VRGGTGGDATEGKERQDLVVTWFYKLKQLVMSAPTAPTERLEMNDLRFLGLKVRDKVTGFVGVCESISYDLYGCIQAVVRQPMNDKGEVTDGRWFDVARLEVVDPKPVMEVPGKRFAVERTSEPVKPSNTHGPAEKPARM
jgi:hypothetical protein